MIALKGPEVGVADQTALIDRMVAATEGYVCRGRDARPRGSGDRPGNLAALYYMGLLYAQTDRPDLLLNGARCGRAAGAAGSVYDRLARGQVEEMAFRAGLTLPAA